MDKQSIASDEKQTEEIVWSEVHQRLEAIQESAEEILAPTTPEGKKQILKGRAKALAREPKRAEAAEESIQVVEFQLAHESYAIESEYIHEVYPLKELTPLPCTPSFVLGIINVRGEVLSVIDIRKLFDLPEKGLTDLNRVIIISMDEMKFGILADTISGARFIQLTDIQPPLPMLTGIRAEYLRGVTSERLVVLDAAKILTDRNIVIHEEVEI
jgi:purine-binding chemotaxis protein CheW